MIGIKYSILREASTRLNTLYWSSIW